MELFDLPPQRKLGGQVHDAVFGDLPASLAAALNTAAVAELVLPLLEAGWRSGQLAARIGGLPAGNEPVAEVQALLRGFIDQVPPDQRWQAERAERVAARSAAAGGSVGGRVAGRDGAAGDGATGRDAAGSCTDRSRAAFEEPASDLSRERWIAHIRSELRGQRRPRPEVATRVRPPCALCATPGDYFVTRGVRLCTACVTLLGSGTATLSEAG